MIGRLLCLLGIHDRWVYEPKHDEYLGCGPWAPVEACERCGR